MLSGVLLLAAACQKTSPPQQETKAPAQLSEETSTPKVSPLTEYQQFLAKLDSGDVTSVSKAADKYTSLFNSQSTSIADSGYVFFDRFYLRVDNTINEIHLNDTTDFYPLVTETEGPIPKKLVDYERKAEANGFEIAVTEGGTYLDQNRDFVANHFYTFVSPDLKEYLEQVNKEDKEGFDEDAGITVTPTQFADRIIWWENFLEKHPNFIFQKEGEMLLESYMTIILTGMDNTPVLSFENNRLDSYYAEAYQYLQKKAPNSKANKVVQPYYKALQKGNTATANALLKQYQKAGIIYNPVSD